MKTKTLKKLLLATGMASFAASTAYGQSITLDTAYLDGLNEQLQSQGYNVIISHVETFAAPGSQEMGQVILSSVHGNKQLAHDWVPGDPRRGGRTNIQWAYDTVDETLDMTSADQRAAITAGTEDWDAETCSNIGVDEIPVAGDLGFVEFLVGLGGSPVPFFDITHGGFLPANTLLGGNTLGATFTFWWTSGGVPTDINNDGRNDTAIREIYYNDGFPWSNDGTGVDLQTVALHEAGHAFSRAHFGNVSIHKGKLKTSPDAVMNAIYGGEQRELAGPDIGGHCSDWGSWPNQ